MYPQRSFLGPQTATLRRQQAIRRRSPWRRLAAGGFAAAAVTMLVLWRTGEFNSEARAWPWVVLARGVTSSGAVWQLDAKEIDGRLCMQLSGPRGPRHRAGYGGECGFDRSQALGDYWVSTSIRTADGVAGIRFGPLPTQATRIRVDTHRVIATHLFPPRTGLPTGRYWLGLEPRHPPPRSGRVLILPVPLDTTGHPVAYAKF